MKNKYEDFVPCSKRERMILTALWIAVVLLVLVAILEIWWPSVIDEGFQSLIAIGDSAFWSRWMPRRGDVGPEEEENGYICDERYWRGYTDVQRLGVNHDYCRMVLPKGAGEPDTFFACGLGGTEGLSTVRYRTQSVKQGFELSRDDYMGSFDGARVGYCRILKTGDDTFECRCNVADDDGFRNRLITDTSPPKHIQTMMQFYEGIVFWLRLRDDMLDYAKNIRIAAAGGAAVKEAPPNPDISEALQFNGVNQFLRLGDNRDLEFGDKVQLRYLRAISFWVYFEEFTNNAHIIDFGNGPGKDNVWIGIVGRGNTGVQAQPIRPLLCGGDNTVPKSPSGAQPAEVVTPQELMMSTPANVNDYVCPKPEVYGAIVPPLRPKAARPHTAINADLVYEVWDHSQRKMRLQVKNAITLRKWTHVVTTATTPDPMRPTIAVYIDGSKVLEEGGWLPQTNYTTYNYVGKSNWHNATSMFDNADELFKGRLFDLRGYRLPMNEKKIDATIAWGKEMLGLASSQEGQAESQESQESQSA